MSAALLTGGGDKPYAYGLAKALIAKRVGLDLIGSDELDCPEFRSTTGVRFLNLRGDQRPDASLITKVLRLSRYYARLICYAVTAKPRIFHILWNNKFEYFDRTLLMLYYRVLRKKIVLTVHNVNAGRRDSNDTHLNRLTLRIQYRLADHIFVHTDKMKRELIDESGVAPRQVTVIPFGINNAVPHTRLSADEARRRLGIRKEVKTILFFGNIAPYKGLDYLISAYQELRNAREEYRLIIAGRPKNCERYWHSIQDAIREDMRRERVLLRAEFIPDEETEVYFKAADILALPYKQIFQSGVLFLGYSFGIPVVASDVGSLGESIIEGETGFLCRPCDPTDLARAIKSYFVSDLYKHLDTRRDEIRKFAHDQHSWDTVGQLTSSVYEQLTASKGYSLKTGWQLDSR